MAQILITATTCLFSITISAIHGVEYNNKQRKLSKYQYNWMIYN